MNSDLTTLVGLAAGVLTTACWVPQIVRSVQTRSTGDLSWPALCALVAGVSLWLAYGLLKFDLAITTANGAALAALLTLARLKQRFDQDGG